MRFFPLLLIAVIIYNVIVFGTGLTHHDVYATLNSAVTIHMFSGDEWRYSFGDFLVTLGLVFLFILIVDRPFLGAFSVDHDELTQLSSKFDLLDRLGQEEPH